jgi:2-oxoisovalerate dehydrogenase E2 component (dihydrolipoyl transacylase)
MATIIELPQVGESVTEGVIGKWLKHPGDQVKKYEPLVEVMTDKVNMEVPSPYAGTLLRTLVAEGDTVPMGEPIAEMDVVGEPSSSSGASPGEAATATGPLGAPGERFEFDDSVRSVGPTGSGEGGQGRPDAIQDAAVGHAPSSGLPRLSPIVRRLVAQHGVDVSGLRGTGVGGRITKEDVLLHVEERAQAPVDATPAREEPTGSAADAKRLPLTPLRKTIAEHLARSAREIPAAWSMVEVDVTGLVAFRAAHRDAFEKSMGVPLSYLPLAALAVSQALMDNPLLNGRWEGDHIALNPRVNLGIAVSTEGGLIVPVVHEADLLNVEGLAVRIHGIVEAARKGTLKLEDVQGGTFTLNNTGALGSIVSAPIINHPQAAIVTTEAIVKRAVVVAGDAISARSIMNVCLTFDHRVCDGAEAGRFLASIKTRLEAIDEHGPLL